MFKISQLSRLLIGVLCLYGVGYGVARTIVFQSVERYTGAEGKGGSRADYIAKRDRPQGEGWEYQVFLPMIKVEEGITYFFNNRDR